MLKPLIIATGALLAVTLVSNQSASAAGYRAPIYRQAARIQRSYSRAAYPRTAYRGTGYARVSYARVGYTRTYPRLNYAARPLMRQPRAILARGIAAYRTVARTRYGRGNLFAARRARLIRNLAGPRSAYVRTASPAAAGGGQVGQASYYALTSRTASGGSVGAATCAHRSLPFGTRVLVTNLANAHQMVLTVNDRGPFIGGRIIDVSRTAAGYLGMLGSGTAPVSVKVVGHS